MVIRVRTRRLSYQHATFLWKVHFVLECCKLPGVQLLILQKDVLNLLLTNVSSVADERQQRCRRTSAMNLMLCLADSLSIGWQVRTFREKSGTELLFLQGSSSCPLSRWQFLACQESFTATYCLHVCYVKCERKKKTSWKNVESAFRCSVCSSNFTQLAGFAQLLHWFFGCWRRKMAKVLAVWKISCNFAAAIRAHCVRTAKNV